MSSEEGGVRRVSTRLGDFLLGRLAERFAAGFATRLAGRFAGRLAARFAAGRFRAFAGLFARFLVFRVFCRGRFAIVEIPFKSLTGLR